MQDCKSVQLTEEELQQFNSFKRQKKLDEARSAAAKLELDLLSPLQEKSTMRFNIAEAARLGVGAVCVPPSFVKFACMARGANKGLCIIACISYPNGNDTTDIKVKAVKRAIGDGADEVEVTAPLSQVKENNWGYVKKEFKKIKRAAKKHAARINIEAPLFDDAQIKKCCALAADVGIVCLRTAGGEYGADSEKNIKLILSAGKDKLIVKSSGAADLTEFYAALNYGALKVSSRNALQIAAQILSETEK